MPPLGRVQVCTTLSVWPVSRANRAAQRRAAAELGVSSTPTTIWWRSMVSSASRAARSGGGSTVPPRGGVSARLSVTRHWAFGPELSGPRSPARARPLSCGLRFVMLQGMTLTGGTAEPIRVFVLDDHEVVRRGLQELLESGGDITVVGESGLAAEATRRIPALRPHVALLDGRLPDGSGIDVCREIRSRQPDVSVLILTSYDDDEALFAAIMAGASGYLLKQMGGTDLVDAVRRVAAGQSLLDPAVTRQVLDRLREGPPQDKALAQLTAQERTILELIGEGLTNRQIGQ